MHRVRREDIFLGQDQEIEKGITDGSLKFKVQSLRTGSRHKHAGMTHTKNKKLKYKSKI